MLPMLVDRSQDRPTDFTFEAYLPGHGWLWFTEDQVWHALYTLPDEILKAVMVQNGDLAEMIGLVLRQREEDSGSN
jgi:hypothetical protein